MEIHLSGSNDTENANSVNFMRHGKSTNDNSTNIKIK